MKFSQQSVSPIKKLNWLLPLDFQAVSKTLGAMPDYSVDKTLKDWGFILRSILQNQGDRWQLCVNCNVTFKGYHLFSVPDRQPYPLPKLLCLSRQAHQTSPYQTKLFSFEFLLIISEITKFILTDRSKDNVSHAIEMSNLSHWHIITNIILT